MNEIDYSKIGLKCGIEVHQQLAVEHKLFCKCSAAFSEKEPTETIIRKLRPVAGEMGEIDIAAMHEAVKNREFQYMIYPNESCLVETDEEPIHDLNTEALGVALTIVMLMNCDIPEEIHVMRKNVLDGSAISSFQRTAIVGLNGWIKTSFGKVGITNVCLEEDAAQIVKKEDNKVVYGLNRLGIPLVEIGTSPDIRSPEQAKEVAEKLGMIVRSTGKAKRGIGTIRQDVNISIAGGARIEIKGAQELRLLPKLVENEALRQKSLIELKKELKKLKFKPVRPRVVHVSHIFRGSRSRITKDKATYAILIPGFAGFLKRRITPDRTLGNEIANYVKVRSELGGIIHSDEDLGKYRLSKEFGILRKRMKAKKGDTLIIAAGEKEQVKKTMGIVCERINYLVKGVPKEVRRAKETGDTEYLRPLPGAARLYPETDARPIKISDKLLRRIRKNLPELIEDREEKERKEIKRKTKISDEIINQIVRMGRKETFDKLISSGFDPKIVSSVLTSTLRYLGKKGVNISKLEDSHFIETLRSLKAGRIPKEAIPEILKEFSRHPGETLENIMKKLGMESISDDDLRLIVQKTIMENPNLSKDPRGKKILLGLVMQKVRGRASASRVMELIEEEMGK
jgi:glutamyl-tRNA(Gln) amidotransferase subunit E